MTETVAIIDLTNLLQITRSYVNIRHNRSLSLKQDDSSELADVLSFPG